MLLGLVCEPFADGVIGVVPLATVVVAFVLYGPEQLTRLGAHPAGVAARSAGLSAMGPMGGGWRSSLRARQQDHAHDCSPVLPVAGAKILGFRVWPVALRLRSEPGRVGRCTPSYASGAGPIEPESAAATRHLRLAMIRGLLFLAVLRMVPVPWTSVVLAPRARARRGILVGGGRHLEKGVAGGSIPSAALDPCGEWEARPQARVTRAAEPRHGEEGRAYAAAKRRERSFRVPRWSRRLPPSSLQRELGA